MQRIRSADIGDSVASPSHALYIELTTRITTRRLHFRSGDEETAVESVHAIFKQTRELMVANPGDEGFLRIAGQMLYLRPGITGIEPRYLLDHWKTHPAFPFESLAEQFFSEEQFEGYRCLGQQAAGSLFREDLGTEENLPVSEFFKRVATHLLPDNDAAFD